jgi:dipeptide/tripeptide permease
MFVTAFLVQYLVGFVISFFPTTAIGYAPEGYKLAFGIFLMLQIASLLWYVLPRQRI